MNITLIFAASSLLLTAAGPCLAADRAAVGEMSAQGRALVVSQGDGVVRVGGRGADPAAVEKALLAQVGKMSAPKAFVLQTTGEGATPINAIRGVRRAIEVLRAHWPEAKVVLKPCDPAGAASVNEEIRQAADGVRVSWGEAGVAAPARPPAKAYEPHMSAWLDFRIAPKRAEIEANASRRYDLVLLGDSITHLWEERGCDIQREFLGGRRILNLGFSGDCTQNILWDAQNGLLDGYEADFVALMIGTNNRGAPAEDVARGIGEIVAEIRRRQPKAKVLLFNVFPCGEKADDKGRAWVASVNDLIRKLDDGRQVAYVRLWDEFLEPDGSISRAVMSDYLHPTAEGYAIWARRLVRLTACK